jgi:ribosomal protein L37AE/L43A
MVTPTTDVTGAEAPRLGAAYLAHFRDKVNGPPAAYVSPDGECTCEDCHAARYRAGAPGYWECYAEGPFASVDARSIEGEEVENERGEILGFAIPECAVCGAELYGPDY